MYSFALVEDNKSDQSIFHHYIDLFKKENNKSIELDIFDNGTSFLDNKNDYDVIFLDIKMSEINGIQIARQVREHNQEVLIVFLTNYDNYAIQGYEVNAYDFLVKPLDYSVFTKRLIKICDRVDKNENKTVNFQIKNGYINLDLRDIYYFASMNHEITCYTFSKDYLLINTCLRDIESLLKDQHFYRSNQSYLVNLRHIQKIDKENVWINNDILKISRYRKKGLVDAFTHFVGELK